MDIKALEALRAIGASMDGFTEAVHNTDDAEKAHKKYWDELEARFHAIRARLLWALIEMYPQSIVESDYPLDDMLKQLYDAVDPEDYLNELEVEARQAEVDAAETRREIGWGKGRFR